MNKTGWAGVGYSVVIWDEVRCASFVALREQETMIADFFISLREHRENWPIVRYYAALEGASSLNNEIMRLEQSYLTVVAQLLLREQDGKPLPPSVAEAKSSELTMIWCGMFASR
jgi:hypothetical protein